MAKKRVYGAQFKAEVVLESLKAEKSAAQICRERGIAEDLLCRWRQQFIENASGVFAKESRCSVEQARIAELERLVGQLTMEMDLSKKLSALWESRCRTSAR